MERNSILILCFVLWSAVVFILQPGCVSPQCKFFGPLCVALVVASNILFLWMGSRTFLKFYVKNMEEKLAKKEAKRRATGEVTLKKIRQNMGLNFHENPLQKGCKKATDQTTARGIELTALSARAPPPPRRPPKARERFKLWDKRHDPSSGQDYYVNMETGKRSGKPMI